MAKATIESVKAELTTLGIAFDEDATLKELNALLPADQDDDQGIVVGDPQTLRPVDLPLVVTLPGSASKAQQAYAKILNAYAYKNPTKWADKKDDKTINGKVVKGLISKLKDLKDAADPIEEPENLTIKNGLAG